MNENIMIAMADILQKKDDAIIKAIQRLRIEMDETCDAEKNCEPDSHWRGCPTVLGPFLKELMDAVKLR